MNKPSENPASPGKDAVEALLEKAAPRPAPPGNVEESIRAAVRSEWEVLTARRRRRRMSAGLAIAATVTLVLAITFSGLPKTAVDPVRVATIDKSVGALYVQSDDSAAQVPLDTSSVVSGQVLTTAKGSVAGLAWAGGGSLRIDSNTRVEFTGADEVYLHEGRIYFDSDGIAPGSGLAVRSAHGLVSHVGTQYLTQATAATLTVSVREGEVVVNGKYHDQPVYEGQRVEVTGSSQPSVTNTSGAGSDWQWIEAVSPTISVDGMTVFDFLQWVGRETGHRVQFKSAEAEALARSTQLKGTVNEEPRTELRLRMMTVDLDARFDPAGPAIVVTD